MLKKVKLKEAIGVALDHDMTKSHIVELVHDGLCLGQDKCSLHVCLFGKRS